MKTGFVEPVQLISLIGQNINSRDMIAIFRLMGVGPEVKSYIEEYYYNYINCGISFLFDAEDDRLRTLFLYSDQFQGFKQYNGGLPNSLDWNLDRQAVHAKLGLPNRSGGGEYSKELNQVTLFWDNYQYIEYTLSLTYCDQSNKICLVCIMPP